MKEKGLTFIELIFVIAIFAVMASIVLFRFDNFNDRVALNNLAQDIALRIVEAQKSAIAGTLTPGFVGTQVRPAYGVYFKSGSTAGTDNTRFVYFNDLNQDKKFIAPLTGQISCPTTPTAGNECISITSMTRGEYISKVCYIVNAVQVPACVTSGQAEAIVTFVRPFPDAWITVDTGNVSIIPERVFIEIRSANGNEVRTIAVENIGKIWVYEGGADLFGQI